MIFPGFQESGKSGSDDLGITINTAKLSRRIDSIEKLPDIMHDALSVAMKQPMGPVHIVIPYNVFQESIPEISPKDSLATEKTTADLIQIKEIESLLESSKKVLLYLGESLHNDSCREAISKIAENYRIPFVTTYGSKGIVSEDHNLNFGNAGYAGRNTANQLILSEELEGVIFFGVKLNERNTLNWNPALLNSSRSIIHVDFKSQNRIFKALRHIKRIIASPADVLLRIAENIHKPYPAFSTDRDKWLDKIRQNLTDYPVPGNDGDPGSIEPGWVVAELCKLLPDNTIMIVDSGQHRLFPGFYWRVSDKGSFLTSSIVAPTGWAIGSAIGAKTANMNRPVVVITGDGCMRMHGLEIQTAVKYKLPLVFYVFNNRAMGSVQQRMERNNIVVPGLIDGYENQWNTFAESINAYGSVVSTESELRNETVLALDRMDRPSILDVSILFPSKLPDSRYSNSAFA